MDCKYIKADTVLPYSSALNNRERKDLLACHKFKDAHYIYKEYSFSMYLSK